MPKYTPDTFLAHLQATFAKYNVAFKAEALARFEQLPFRPSKLKELQALAYSRGGECLSTKFVSTKDKLHWRCAEGHEWHAKVSNVMHKGYWCPECSGWNAMHPVKADPLQELREIAEATSGRLLSADYVNNRTPLEFQCSAGHTWAAEPWTIKRNHWCPYCTKKKLADPLGDLRELAAAKGGECLGAEYRNNRERQPFRCAAGHEFTLRPLNVKHHGMWCPTCRKAAPARQPEAKTA